MSVRWPQFAALDLQRIKGLLRYSIVIDGRNLYSSETMQKNGLLYVSVGRRTTELESVAASPVKS